MASFGGMQSLPRPAGPLHPCWTTLRASRPHWGGDCERAGGCYSRRIFFGNFLSEPLRLQGHACALSACTSFAISPTALALRHTRKLTLAPLCVTKGQHFDRPVFKNFSSDEIKDSCGNLRRGQTYFRMRCKIYFAYRNLLQEAAL